MKNPRRYLLRLEHGRDEPIRDLEGARRVILIDEDTVGAQDLTFGHCRFAPRTSFHKKHVHAQAEEMMYVLSGRMRGGVGDQEMEFSAGDTIWVPRGEVHWADNPFDEPCEILFLYTRRSLEEAGYDVVE
jgi:quercetin dioxygenase-like cupin family protein